MTGISVGGEPQEVALIRVPGWAEYGWLRHGFSGRAGGRSVAYGPGELNLGFTREDDREVVGGNRAAAVAAVGGGDLVTLRQVHGVAVRVVRGEDVAGGGGWEADGMMTAVRGVVLGIQVADCVPVLVADVRLRVVAGFHAGWRGTAAGMVEGGIALMRKEFGTRVEDLVGAMGPAIGVCCYVVGEEVRERFADAALFRVGADGVHLDLAEANRRQMEGAGIAAGRVWVSGECTRCSWVGGRRRFFSYRGEGGVTGRAMGLIGVG